MSFDVLRSPMQFLQQVGTCADQDWLREYEAWFEREGQGISPSGGDRYATGIEVMASKEQAGAVCRKGGLSPGAAIKAAQQLRVQPFSSVRFILIPSIHFRLVALAN